MSKYKLNGNRKGVYEYLVQYINENGYAPTLAEISSGVGLKSKASVHTILNQLSIMQLINYGSNNEEFSNARTITLRGYKLIRDKSVRLDALEEAKHFEMI